MGQFGNMMFGFPGHCMGLLLFFDAIRGSKRHLRLVGKVGEGAFLTKTVNESKPLTGLGTRLHRVELTTVFVHIMMQWSICLPIYNATLLTL